MAEQATAAAETKQKTTGNGAAPTGRGYKTISKVEAVRRSLEKLGREATNSEIQADVLERFGLVMTTNHVSTCKGDLRKAEARKAKAKKDATPTAKTPTAKPTAKLQPAATTPATTTHSKTSHGQRTAVELDDILAVKALVDRVGAGHLRTLIDVMAK